MCLLFSFTYKTAMNPISYLHIGLRDCNCAWERERARMKDLPEAKSYSNFFFKLRSFYLRTVSFSTIDIINYVTYWLTLWLMHPEGSTSSCTPCIQFVALLKILFSILFISRSTDFWKIYCTFSLCSRDKLSYPPFSIFFLL